MGIKGNKKTAAPAKGTAVFVCALSSADNLENQLEDSVNYLLAQPMLLKESEDVADKLQESLEELHKSLSALMELRENLDDLMNERSDEFHDLLPPFYIYGN